jgi:formylglycine-generating enzyme required for sulfatase activity
MIAKWFKHLSLLATVSLIASAAQATPITASLNGYDLVKVGNPNNTAQSGAGGNQNGYGAVTTDFWIGKNHVTIGQYTEFLNAVAKTNNRGLYNASMNTDQRIRGIQQSGSDGAFVYTVVGPNGTNPAGATSPANRPITYVSWFDSARFANWMANGKPTGAAGSTTTDNGAYNLGAATTGNAPALNLTNPNTGVAPAFSIPTENQWYKAAYYSPVKVADSTPGYFLYGTGSDFTPGNGWNGTAALANKDLANQANYRLDDGTRYAVTGGTTTINDNSNQNLLTDVGAFTNTYSYYGAFDMSGNAWDWNNLNDVAGSSRGIRGGPWISNASQVSSASRATLATSYEDGGVSFRLASPVPEPATLGMTSVGALCACGWWILKRRRRART